MVCQSLLGCQKAQETHGYRPPLGVEQCLLLSVETLLVQVSLYVMVFTDASLSGKGRMWPPIMAHNILELQAVFLVLQHHLADTGRTCVGENRQGQSPLRCPIEAGGEPVVLGLGPPAVSEGSPIPGSGAQGSLMSRRVPAK